MEKLDNVLKEKKRLRKEILSIRDAIPPFMRKEKSDKILQTVYALEEYKKAQLILTYVDYQSEVITSTLIEKALIDGKRVFCPKVSGNDMDFYCINGLEELKEGYKGIREPEPVSEKKFPYTPADQAVRVLVIVPGVVFDRDCHRIGYGKGFYDRFMTRVSENKISVYTLGLGYECQLIDKVPFEKHDINLDMIVTENGIYGREI